MTVSPGDLATERLLLEALRADHADEMATVLADPALYRFTGGDPPTPEALRAQYALQARGLAPDGTEIWHNWVVRLRADGTAIGFVQATVTDGGRAADIAWVIGTAWQGRGYATEAADAMIDRLVAGGVRTITAHVQPENEASIGVAGRLGLHDTGRVEDGERVWRRDVAGAAAVDAAERERRRRLLRLNLGVGTALIAFALFEVVFVRSGALPASPDQVVRDVLLAGAGVVMLGGALLAWRRGSGDRPS